jgi:hypothetical protein
MGLDTVELVMAVAEEFQLEIPDAAAFSVWSSRSRRDALLSMLRCGPASAVSPRPRRFGILPRCGPASTSMYWRSPHAAHPASLTDPPTIPVSALATVLLAHALAFAGMLLTPALARHRRVRDVTLTRPPGFRPCYIPVARDRAERTGLDENRD